MSRLEIIITPLLEPSADYADFFAELEKISG
jgi:hypothetical protein